MTTTGQLLDIFTGPKDSPLKNPSGIWVDDDGNMFIADTGNYRIVHLSAKGEFVEEFTRPKSTLLSSDFIFDPTKVAISPTGQIYALKGQYLICIDAQGNFRGYVGQSKVAYSLTEAVIRLLGSKAQQTAIRTRIAASYTNIYMDESGMIYATTQDSRDGQLKILNAVGINIYRDYNASDGFTMFNNFFRYSFDDLNFTFGDYSLSQPNFCDLTVDKNGVVSAIDAATSKIFQYDKEGNLLTIFGANGNNDGSFKHPISIVSDNNGNLYILDMLKNNIQIFAPTKFIKTIHEAVQQYHLGDYQAAETLWKEVLNVCESYSMANIGLALAAYHQEDWTASMEQYRLAGDRTGYSESFSKYRRSILREHFLLVAGLTIVVIIVFVAIFVLLKRISAKAMRKHLLNEPDRYSNKNMLFASLGIIYHPFDTISIIKNSRKRLHWWIGIGILIAVFITRIINIYAMHYPLVSLDPQEANLLLEFAKLIIPVITYALASFLVISIVGGESTFIEIFTSFSMSMLPYIYINLTLTALSHVLCREEEGLFVFLSVCSVLIPVLLMILSINLLNNYSFRKTIVVAVLSVLVMLLLWILIIMIAALSVQLYEFIIGIINEIRMLSL